MSAAEISIRAVVLAGVLGVGLATSALAQPAARGGGGGGGGTTEDNDELLGWGGMDTGLVPVEDAGTPGGSDLGDIMWLIALLGIVFLGVLGYHLWARRGGSRPDRPQAATGRGFRRGGALRLLAVLLSGMGLIFAVGGILVGVVAIIGLMRFSSEPSLAHLLGGVGPALSGLLGGLILLAFGQFLACIAYIEENTRLARDELAALGEHLRSRTTFEATAEEES